MNDLLRRLLDLRTLDWADPSVRFAFERPIPAWGWVTIVVLALALAFWSYSRLAGRGWVRGVLSVVRGGLLVLLAVLVAGPQLVQTNESVERDWLIVMADRSASMTIPDVMREGGERRTREEQLGEALERNRAMFESLARERTVVWLGFDSGVYDVAGPVGGGGGGDGLGTPQGRRTLLGSALEQALSRAVARPLSAVVVLSDGRSSDELSRAALRRLQTDLVPVHTVALGSADPVGDVAIRRVDAPRVAFVGDITPVRVDLERVGRSAGGGVERVTVRLTDTLTGAVLDEQEVEFDGSGADGADAPSQARTVALTHRSSDPGAAAWTVDVIPDRADLVAENNTAPVAIELVDRPMRVLYIDGYPRWEQRYLRSLLIRENSIVSSTLMLAPDRRFTQEGDVEIDALPDSPERWAEFDAVILGDVSPDVFTEHQLTGLRDHVALRGAGLIWIGGPGHTPSAWWNTPLADVLPFVKEATDGTALDEPVLLTAMPGAARLGVLQLGMTDDEVWPKELADPQTGWSLLRWAQRLDPGGLKPTAEVLAMAEPALDPSRATPLILLMRYGAGRSMYVATDEIWRWRYGRGEKLYERFWLQLIRMLGRESLSRSGALAILEADPSRAVVDQPVRVVMELLDQSLVDLGLPTITVELERAAGPGESGPARPIEMVLRPDEAGRRAYAAVWLPSQPGVWTIRPTDSSLAPLGLLRRVEVVLPDDELRSPETDHALLARLSDQTGGRVLTPDEMGQLPEHLPNRQVRLVNEVTESLWDTPLALILVVLFLTFEWVGRRVISLI